MDKQTFCSSQTTSNTSRYAAALYRQGTHSGLLRGLSGWEGSRVRAGQWQHCSSFLHLQPNPTPNPAWLPGPQASLRLFPCPQAGVDPQLYVTITISIIIVLVATGIIFKFW